MKPTLEQVQQWALDAGLQIAIYAEAYPNVAQQVERLVSVAYSAGQAAEREACAKVCEQHAYDRFNEHGTREHDTGATYYQGAHAEELEARDEECHDLAAAIRARGAA